EVGEPFHWAESDRADPLAQALGELIAALIPPEIVVALERGSGQTLVLNVQNCYLPWELAVLNDGTCLGQRYLCTRELGSGEPGESRPGSPLRALLVLDPERLLSWYGQEQEWVESSLGPGWKVDVLSGVQATAGTLRSSLDSGRYGLIHLLAYADALVQSPDESRLFLADGAARPSIGRTRPAAVPRLMCLNLCSAGDPQPGCPGPALAVTWARTFLDMGVSTVLATQWDLSPESAADFFGTIYRNLASGRTLEEGLRAARSAQRGPCRSQAVLAFGPLTWRQEDLRPTSNALPATRDTKFRPTHTLIVLEGPEAGREIPLMADMMEETGPVTLGRSGPRDLDIELDDPEAGNPSARFDVEDGRLFLTHVESPLRVNGLLLTGRIELTGGEMLQFGQTSMMLRQGASRPPTSASRPRGDAPRFAVEVLLGPDRGRRETIQGALFVVGRQPDCQFRLTDPAVSRQHCLITMRDEVCHLSNLGSNPTVVNGVVVEREVALRHGDRIRLGEETELRLMDLTRGAD
ncbi:MAG: FHA domain-containing protein, partial [Candidatus Eremiobacterota bacterium]